MRPRIAQINDHTGFSYVKTDDEREYISIGTIIWYDKNTGRLCNYSTNKWLETEWQIEVFRKIKESG